MALGKVSSPSHTRGKQSFRKNATSWKLRFSFSAVRPPRTQRHRKSPLQRRGLRWLLANWLLQIPHCLKHLSSDPKEATGGVCLLFRPPRAFCGSQFPSQCSVLPLLGGGVFGFVARVREIAQGLEIILRQRHEGFATPRPAPAIALDAADEPLAVVVDLDQRAMAVGAIVNINHPVPWRVRPPDQAARRRRYPGY